MAPPWWALLPICSAILCGVLGTEYGWLPQKEYAFSVHGQDLAGLPQLKAQYAGFLYHGELRVQSHSPRVLLIKILNINYTTIHEELPEGWWKGPEPASRNKTKTLPLTTSTVVVKLTKSVSPQLVIQSGLDDWQVNFIKGLVSNLLAYRSEKSPLGPNSNPMSNSQPKDTFSVIEDSVVGQCEVLYEVSPLPSQLAQYNSNLCNSQQLWEVTKTRNYSNCQLLSEDHAHLPTKDCTPGGANCGSFWTRASLTQMIGCGEKNNFVLLSSVTCSVINAQLHLESNSQAVINSNLNITLISILDLKRKFNPPQNKQTVNSLLYTYSNTTKDLYSGSCQDDGSNSGENNVTEPQSEGQNFSGQMNSTNENNNKHLGKKEKPLFRNKRGLKKQYGNKYKTESNGNNKNDNNYPPKEYQNSDDSPNTFRNKTSNGKSKSQQQSSEEFINQPSEEMQLEDQWKISSKGLKSSPPHQPFNMLSLAHRTSSDLSCLSPKLRQIIADIASDLEDINILPEKNTMDKLSLAVDICRLLSLDLLSSVSEEIFEVHSGIANTMKSNERKVFRDMVTMCGTHPALQLIKGWVGRQQVDGEEAAEIIASLPSHIFSPSSYLVQDFFEMVKQIAGRGDRQLTTTAVLALSNLVRGACVNQMSRQHHFSSIVKPVCTQDFTSHVIEWLTYQMDSEPQLRRVYIEALGNIGSPEVIETLRAITLMPQHSSYIQTSSVFAMRYQVLRNDLEVAPVLMSLYHNYSLPASTRIAAAALLVYSNPGLALWQRLAISTWYEPSETVAQFVASSLHTMATSKDSLYASISKSATLVQHLARPVQVKYHQPYNLMTSLISSDLQKLILEQLSWMNFYDFTSLYYRHSSRSSGFSRTNIEASFTAGNPDGLWSALKELIISTNGDQSARPPTSGISRTFSKIQKSLDLRSISMPQLQAELHLKFNNILERMLIVNKDTFKTWAKGGRKLVSEVLTEGKTLSYQKADMNSFHISTTTELGFPVQFTVRTPWIVSAKADLNVTDKGFVVGAAFMYSSQLLSSVAVMSPWDNTAHSAGAYVTNFFQLPPFRMAMTMDSSMEAIKVTTAYIDQHRLLYFSMQPFTSQRNIKIHHATLLSPDTRRIKLGGSIQMPISWLSRYLNTVYSTEETEYFNPMDFIQQARCVVGFPMIMPNMESRSFETVMNPLHPVVMNLSMTMVSKSSGLLDLESPMDTIIGQIFNALTKAEKSDKSPLLPTIKQQNSKTGESGDKEQIPLNDNETTTAVTTIQTAQTKKESSTEKKAMASSSEESVLMDVASSPYVGDYNVYSITYETPTGSYNASYINPFVNMVNGSRHYYLIEQSLSKINSGKAVVFGLDMWSSHPDQSTKVSAFATYATTFSDRASRFGFFMKKDNSQLRFTSAYETPVDIATDLKRLVTEDLQHYVFVDYVQAKDDQQKKAFIKASLGVSRARLAQLRASPLLEACSQLAPQYYGHAMDLKCQQLQSQAKGIGFGNITVYYNEHVKFLENMAQAYMNTAKVMLPRTEERAGEGFNTMTMIFDVNPSMESVNAQITTPASSIDIRRFPLSKLPMSTFTEWAMQNSALEEFCGLSTQRVRTFDGAEFQYRMKDSWHLVTQDCSGKYGVSILAQPMNNISMKAEINIDDHFAITLEEGPKVYMNNKLQPLDSTHPLMRLIDKKGHVIAHTVYTPDNSIHIHLPQDKLELVYSGTSFIIRAKQGLQGRLCGLCGSYTNTGIEQFLTAQGSVAKSPAEFSTSYMLKGFKSEHMEINN